MNSVSVSTRYFVALAAAVLCIASAASTSAQVQTTTTITSGIPTKEVKIESGEVVAEVPGRWHGNRCIWPKEEHGRDCNQDRGATRDRCHQGEDRSRNDAVGCSSSDR